MKVSKPLPTVMEVDIHGLMASDAKARLEHLLSNAGPQVEEVVVIHGYSRGTVLRDMVRNQLKHPDSEQAVVLESGTDPDSAEKREKITERSCKKCPRKTSGGTVYF